MYLNLFEYDYFDDPVNNLIRRKDFWKFQGQIGNEILYLVT